MTAPITKLLIANRGEIACRVIQTAQSMGIRTVAVYSDADASARHVAMADEAVRLGPPPAADSYLKSDLMIAAAKDTGAQAIHPGYGFLSENPEFVDAVEAAGLIFVGPSAASIRAMGLKDAAKDLMIRAGVPVVPGYQGAEQDADFLAAEAERIGYPVLIKARAGGGGKGMRKVDRPNDFRAALEAATREGQASFGDGRVLIEKFITSPRHIEVQVFGDSHGTVVHLFERDCSLQRRHQKVIEEAPAPGMTDEMRAAMTDAAVKAARAISYSGAGTIEFIVDGSGPLRPDGFWFMEMNTRLQVEHPVTEAITGVDLVEWQLRIAAGEPIPMPQEDLTINGHAFEARLYAEDPVNGFLPATGRLEQVKFSQLARNDTGVRAGDGISPFYDPMIAKVITHADSRKAALTRLVDALQETHLAGTVTNTEFLIALAKHDGFREGQVDTGLIERNLDGLVSVPPLSEAHVAVAGIAALDLDPTAPHFGWRLWEEAAHELRLLSDADLVERRVVLHQNGRIELTGGADSVTLSDVLRTGDRISARMGSTQRMIEANVAVWNDAQGTRVSVLIEGVVREFLLPDARWGTSAETGQGDAVLAPMTGMLIALDVAEGDLVDEGDRVGIMEAMKMETTLTAPRAGRVKAVLSAVGDTVEGGAVVITFAEEANA
ncbi:acetyl/propionyl/methylcrotonyl-CoA carboxylase subunit alpha [Qingshengfaniella alkalisoli]|uniref:Acetyl/propionyl/methylcrotonyl-CoA carboxylase subunit alpha n=1 Tax=Qingshengfaniella alkalisoli TaxID=2599296 RepID=A0A5B8I8G3_9RHOB|nr:acetyl/propionyl/methylcrotonyl-CoA carboxylase subunit alpha [Qingshengfaniella alkalisoli]QDY70275.1 acetyl/propionyl/methylcrotonyl-CoA carboxylase subunit alpha [Qingshengfaniella alkalisoli]